MASRSSCSASSPSKYSSENAQCKSLASMSLPVCFFSRLKRSKASFTTMRCSHVLSLASPLNSSSLFHTFIKVFCKASSASSCLPTIWRIIQYSLSLYCSTNAAKALRLVASFLRSLRSVCSSIYYGTALFAAYMYLFGCVADLHQVYALCEIAEVYSFFRCVNTYGCYLRTDEVIDAYSLPRCVAYYESV